MSEEIKDIPVKEKPVKAKAEEKQVSGLVGFIKDGVTILRDVSLEGELAASGWILKMKNA